MIAVGWWGRGHEGGGQEGKHRGEAPHLHPAALFLCRCICQPSFLRPLVGLPHCIRNSLLPVVYDGGNVSESVPEKCKWIAQVLSYLTEFTIMDFAQCAVEGRTVHVKIRKQERVLRIQSIHYKVWSINSIIPSAQLTHQHSYSITFFSPLSFVLWTAFSFLWGNLSDQLELGCSEQLFSLKYCFPTSFTFKKYCVLTCWKRPRPSQLGSESAFVRDDVGVWKEHLGVWSLSV